MSIQSSLSKIVATQVGRIQGELEARIQSEALSMLNKFANSCPVQKELKGIIDLRNNLLDAINQFEKTTGRFKKLTNQLLVPIRAAKILRKLLLKNPIPTAIIFHPGGRGVSLGKTTTLAGRLRKVEKLLEALEDDVKSVNGLVSGIEPRLLNIRTVLQSVDVKLIGCIEELDNPDELLALLNQAQPRENTGSEGTPDESYKYRSKSGRDYTLEIIEDKSIKSTVPRRIAVAKDNIGIIVLQGQSSFSSSTKILLDELKFRIDNQLP